MAFICVYNIVMQSTDIEQPAQIRPIQPNEANPTVFLQPAVTVAAPVPTTAPLTPQVFQISAHPYVLLFHVLFKFLALFSYWVVYYLTQWFVGMFVLTTTFLAFDFWVVKNVSGRFLAGLRWWSFVKEDGSNDWVFEALDQNKQNQLKASDVNFFWNSLYFFAAYWLISGFFNLLTLNTNNLVVCLIGSTFSLTNVMAYRKCSNASLDLTSINNPANVVRLMAASRS